jgi:hypothetical protein
MSEPQTMDEYNARFTENYRTEGWGIAGVTQVMPCPFCASPDWASWRIFDLAVNDYADMRKSRKCAECGRSARIDVQDMGDTVTSEIIQTGGAPAPAWLKPAPRREH